MTGESRVGSSWIAFSSSMGSEGMILSSTTGGWTTFDLVITGVEVMTAGSLAMTPRFSRITT